MDTLKNACAIAILLLLAGCSPSLKSPRFYGEIPAGPQADTGVQKTPDMPEYDSIQVKYARYLSVTPDIIENTKLYYFIEKWMNTPYKWGGTNQHGIDCSAFLQRLLAEVYMIRIPRTSIQQFLTDRVERFRSTDHLSEGDLVFFRTRENTYVSHVGLYLHNQMFVNSSSSKGVSLASLNTPYWKKRYVAAGRIKINAPGKSVAGK